MLEEYHWGGVLLKDIKVDSDTTLKSGSSVRLIYGPASVRAELRDGTEIGLVEGEYKCRFIPYSFYVEDISKHLGYMLHEVAKKMGCTPKLVRSVLLGRYGPKPLSSYVSKLEKIPVKDTPRALSLLLEEARIKHGLNHNQMAKAMGLARKTIWRISKGDGPYVHKRTVLAIRAGLEKLSGNPQETKR